MTSLYVSLCDAVIEDFCADKHENGRLKVETPQSIEAEKVVAAATRSLRTRKTAQSAAERLLEAAERRATNPPKTGTKKSTEKTAAKGPSGGVTSKSKKSTGKSAAKEPRGGVTKSSGKKRNKSPVYKPARQLQEEALVSQSTSSVDLPMKLTSQGTIEKGSSQGQG